MRVKVDLPESFWRDAVMAVFRPNRQSPLAGQFELAIVDAAERLLLPAIERDVRRELSDKAAAHAIHVFADNLRALLSQPPLAGINVLGIDPGFRTGSKVAVVDATGKVMMTTTIYPHEPQKEKEKSLKILAALVMQYKVALITIGNGTASRETEQLSAQLTRNLPAVKYIITNEAGASVYSASPLARQEMPDLDDRIRAHDFVPILNWLKKKIHIVGRGQTSAELVRSITGGELSAWPLIDFLKERVRR